MTIENHEKWKLMAEKWIADHKEELIQEIQELVRIPSVSHPEEAAPGAPFGAECRKARRLR